MPSLKYFSMSFLHFRKETSLWYRNSSIILNKRVWKSYDETSYRIFLWIWSLKSISASEEKIRFMFSWQGLFNQWIWSNSRSKASYLDWNVSCSCCFSGSRNEGSGISAGVVSGCIFCKMEIGWEVDDGRCRMFEKKFLGGEAMVDLFGTSRFISSWNGWLSVWAGSTRWWLFLINF